MVVVDTSVLVALHLNETCSPDVARWYGANGPRAGDALHLASVLDAGVKRMATLDEVLARNSRRVKLNLAVR